jgi:hypothetical protein
MEIKEITYSCGHYHIIGGNIADPTGQTRTSTLYENSIEKCWECLNPDKVPFSALTGLLNI